MGVVNAWFFTGRNRLYCYGVEKAYADYQFSNVQSPGGGDVSDNPKIEALSNVTGGRGFFAGMVLDSFDILIKADSATLVYSYPAARAYTCRENGWFETRDCAGWYREFCRDNGWVREDCRLDAVYAVLDSTDSLLPADIRDSVRLAWSQDSALNVEAERRFCIDRNYPEAVPACAPVRAECVDGALGNPCQRVLWKSCELAYWKPAACAEGRRSYCRDRSDVHTVLCRGVENP
jgi:hypothetical protein